MDFSLTDARKLLSRICNQEELVDKKRKWLQSSIPNPDGSQKKSKRPKFLNDVYIPESIVRSGEISCENVRANVEKCFEQPFSNSCKFQPEPLKLKSVCPSLLSSIERTLEGLDGMTSHELVLVNRKLRGLAVVPQFPSVTHKEIRDLLIERVRKKCSRHLSKLKEGCDLPINFAKALSVIQLSVKHKLRSTETFAPEFFSVSKEALCLQNDILRALWSLQQIKSHELKFLQPLLDPDNKVLQKTFRRALTKYLIECLFECDEVIVPDKTLEALAFINERQRCQLSICRKEAKEGEVGDALNVSSYLKAFVASLVSDGNAQEEVEDMDDIRSDDECYMDGGFDLSGTNYFLNCADFEHLQACGCSNNVLEITGDTEPVFSEDADCVADNILEEFELEPKNDVKNDGSLEGLREFYPHDALWGMQNSGENAVRMASEDVICIAKEPKRERDDDIEAITSHPEDSNEVKLQISPSGKRRNTEIVISKICDETAISAHSLIGNMLESFLQVDGRGVDAYTQSYLRGGPVSPANLQGAEDLMDDSTEKNMRAKVLVHAVENVIPSLPKNCIDRVKRVLQLP